LDYFRADFERRFEKVVNLPDHICVDKRELAQLPFFQLTYEPIGRNRKTSAEAHREQQNAWVLLDRDQQQKIF
jgi:hypothetical protein